MNNGFEKHGIKYLSASQINMFADCPAAYISSYLFGNKGKLGVAGQIGTLVERVVVAALCGEEFNTALEGAKNSFRRDNALNTNEAELKRVDDIEPMAKLALDELRQYGAPEFVQSINGQAQQRIETACNGAGWRIPIIGYLDLVYPKDGLIVDLKTTSRMPSSFSAAHKRQAALYRQARGNMAVKFLYVTPKKSAWFEDENHMETLLGIKALVSRMEAFLSAGDKEYLRKITPVNTDSFYWTGNEKIRKELFGL